MFAVSVQTTSFCAAIVDTRLSSLWRHSLTLLHNNTCTLTCSSPVHCYCCPHLCVSQGLCHSRSAAIRPAIQTVRTRASECLRLGDRESGKLSPLSPPTHFHPHPHHHRHHPPSDAMAAINLRTLQRLDSGIEEILLSVCHVCLYEFSVPDGVWQQARIEGPLHVYRKGRRTHGFVILNRNDTNHLNEILTPDFEFWLQGQFLEYKDHSNRIFCIWFYKESDARQVHTTICQQQQDSSSHASQENGHQNDQHQNTNGLNNHNNNGTTHVSIMDLLRRGYEKRSRLSTDSNITIPSMDSPFSSSSPAHAHRHPQDQSRTAVQHRPDVVPRTRTISVPTSHQPVFPLTRRDCGFTEAQSPASNNPMAFDPIRLLMNGSRRRRTTGCAGVGSESERSQRQAV